MYKKEEKEDLILEAALKVIKEKGFHGARMADIARKAGISYGLIYHYFKNKEAIFDAIIKRWWKGLFRSMEAMEENGDIRSRLLNIIYYFLNAYKEQPDLVNIFITEISRSTVNLNEERLGYFKRFMELTDRIMQDGIDCAYLRQDIKARYLTYIFLGALETFVSAMVLVSQRLEDDSLKHRIASSILEVFLNGARKRE